MRAVEVINEGPLDSVRDKWSDIKQGRDAKKLQKRREKTLRKFAPKVWKSLIDLVNKVVVSARAKQRSVNPDVFDTLIPDWFEKVVRLDLSLYPNIQTHVKELVSSIKQSPSAVVKTPGVERKVELLLSLALKEKDVDAIKANKTKQKDSAPKTVYIQKIKKELLTVQNIKVPNDANVVVHDGNKGWWFGLLNLTNTDRFLRIGSKLNKNQIDVLEFEPDSKNKIEIKKDHDEPLVYHVLRT